MKNLVFAGVAILGSAAMAAPTFSDLTAAQNPQSGVVEISYRISETAVVTLDDVLVGGVSVGPSNVTSVSGHTGIRVDGSATAVRTILWNAPKDIPGRTLAGTLTAKLSAWPLATPPDYLVAALDDAMVTNVRFYASEANLPGGIASDLYRSTRLAMRRIPAKDVIWRMGYSCSFAQAEGSQKTNAVPHYVKLTSDYYMGVLPVTQAQYRQIDLSTPSGAQTAGDDLPAAFINCGTLRGTNGWPQAGHVVTASSAIGRFRLRTGLELDLPTSAQWEYACRAATSTRLNNGTDSSAADIAWYSYKSGGTWHGNADGKFHRCGTKKPNAWGLYDMHGNCWEWCLDFIRDNYWNSDSDNFLQKDYAGAPIEIEYGGQTLSVSVDPVGVGSATKRVMRGAGVTNGPNNTYSDFVYSTQADNPWSTTGFRLVCPIPTL